MLPNLFLIPQTDTLEATKGFITSVCMYRGKPIYTSTGALSSMPTDTLDACLDLLPFHLLVEKVTH